MGKKKQLKKLVKYVELISSSMNMNSKMVNKGEKEPDLPKIPSVDELIRHKEHGAYYSYLFQLIHEQKPLMIVFYCEKCAEINNVRDYVERIRNSKFEVCGKKIPQFELEYSDHEDLARYFHVCRARDLDIRFTPTPVVILFLNNADCKHPIQQRFTGVDYYEIADVINGYNKAFNYRDIDDEFSGGI